jgi:hypothetical protein
MGPGYLGAPSGREERDMSTITVAQDIEDARERLTPKFAALRDDMCGHFWETFGAAAARYRAARSEGPAAREFAGIVRELERDAQGSLSSFPREVPAPAPVARKPWATMPTDGSDRLTLPERITYALIGAACVAALVLLAWTTGLIGGSDADAGAPVQPVSVVGIPAGPGTPDRDAARELIIEGAWLSWQAYTECGEGPAQCDAVLREVNANPYGVHFFEDGSAVDPARN